MPIINAEVTETTTITQNGTYNVAKYTTANVKTPVANYYVEDGIAHRNGLELNGDEFSAITEIDNYAMYYAFYNSIFSGVVDLSNVQSVGLHGLDYAFYQGKITGLKLSGKIIGENALYYACYRCEDLENVDFSGLTEISGFRALNSAFRYTKVAQVIFPDLTAITSEQAFDYCFSNTELKFLSFPALTTVTYDCFSNMLSGVRNCTVVFPAELESTITSFTSYSRGFGGTNTSILFGSLKMLPVSIPSGWTVEKDNVALTSGDIVPFVVGDNSLYANDGNNHFATINFVVTDDTTEFVFDPAQIEFNQITFEGNEDNVSYKVGTIYSGSKAYANVILPSVSYFTSDYILSHVECIKDGWLGPEELEILCDSDKVVYFSLSVPTVITYSASDLLSNLAITEGYENKYSVNNNQLVVHTEDNVNQHFSGGLSMPEGAYIVRITGSALVSSEANYDFGYLFFGTYQPDFTYTEIKNQQGEQVVFKQSGTTNSVVAFDRTFYINPSEQNILTIGWAQDKTIKGDNTMWVDPITIQYLSNNG